jgi:light-regulated signal transduction histidine kinase (bacteriophytochrome)
VTGAPNIRFYAGAPLITETGEGLGTLCVIDTVSRELTTQQQRALMVLRTHVLKLMELRIQTRSLYELKQELDEYKHTISHDLRAPLRSVIGFSKILIEDHAPELDENVQSLLQRILTEGSRMDQLTSELVYLLRLESTKLEILQVNLSELANRELAHLQSTQPDRKINISIQPGLTTTGDLNLLRTMLHELFYNAWKYTQHTPEARIEFGRLNDNESKEYYLRDNGIGFEMAYAKKLFQPFQTMHVAPELHGIGVGLAKVKKIIQKHAGHVRAESFPEEGTTIYFTLAG